MSRRRSNLGIDYVGGLKEESTAFAGAGLLLEHPRAYVRGEGSISSGAAYG